MSYHFSKIIPGIRYFSAQPGWILCVLGLKFRNSKSGPVSLLVPRLRVAPRPRPPTPCVVSIVNITESRDCFEFTTRSISEISSLIMYYNLRLKQLKVPLMLWYYERGNSLSRGSLGAGDAKNRDLLLSGPFSVVTASVLAGPLLSSIPAFHFQSGSLRYTAWTLDPGFVMRSRSW